MPVINGTYSRYYSQSARDAVAHGDSYADSIERHALETVAYYVLRGDLASAQRMLTRSLSAALTGNDGE